MWNFKPYLLLKSLQFGIPGRHLNCSPQSFVLALDAAHLRSQMKCMKQSICCQLEPKDILNLNTFLARAWNWRIIFKGCRCLKYRVYHLRSQSLELTREGRHASRNCAVKNLRPHCFAPRLQSLCICCASSPLALL